MPRYTGRYTVMVDFIYEVDLSDSIIASDREEAMEILKEQAIEYFKSGKAFKDKNWTIFDHDVQNFKEYDDDDDEVDPED
jgi:regulator of RNase E activity RraB